MIIAYILLIPLLVLFPYIGYYGAQDEMFEDIGAVSGMEAVSVAEHMVT